MIHGRSRGAGHAAQPSRPRRPRSRRSACSISRGASRSNSCAHTAERHTTVTTPARSETGPRLARDRLPTACSHDACTSARSVAGASRSRSPATASASGAGAAHALLRRSAGTSASTGAPEAAVRRRQGRALVGRRDELCPAAAGRRALAALGVELAEDVVEQHHRSRQRRATRRARPAATPGGRGAAGPESRSGVAPGPRRQHEVIAMGPVEREAALQIGARRSGAPPPAPPASRRERGRYARRSPRGRGRRRGRRTAAAGARRCRRWPSARPRAGQLAVPGLNASVARRRRDAAESALRWASAARMRGASRRARATGPPRAGRRGRAAAPAGP